MKKTETANGSTEYSWKAKDHFKFWGTLFLFLAISFGIVTVVLSAIQPKQIIYDNAVTQYNQDVDRLLSSRMEVLEAERDLAKEKLEIAMTEENWDEMIRLKNKIENIDQTIEKGNWQPFACNQEEGEDKKKTMNQ